MIVKGTDLDIFSEGIPRAGSGKIAGYRYLSAEEMKNKTTGFYVNELMPESEIGFHQHVGNEEIYFILSGKAIVNDNGNEVIVGPGDLVFTQSGEYHGMKNIGEEKLRFVAFIINL